MAISWPKFTRVINVVPIILEAVGIQAPAVVDGIPQKPVEGLGFMYIFDASSRG